MRAIGRHPQRAADGSPVQYEPNRPERITPNHLVQQQVAAFIEQGKAEAGADPARFVKG